MVMQGPQCLALLIVWCQSVRCCIKWWWWVILMVAIRDVERVVQEIAPGTGTLVPGTNYLVV